MNLHPNTVLWAYIVLLVVGGMIGFFKANSKASLITSCAFAAVLVLSVKRIIFQAYVADIVLAVLLVFFGYRLMETKKFMPNGLMLVLTLAALVLRNVHF